MKWKLHYISAKPVHNWIGGIRGFYLVVRWRKNMKKLTLLFFIFITLTTISCSDDSVTDYDVTNLSGLFKAITFIEPGTNDSGVNILANNGKLTVQFGENLSASGQLLIPDNIESNYSPIDTNFAGSYILNGDTIRFKNTNVVLDNPNVYFINKGSTLETPDYQGRWALFKIILEKQ